MKTFNIKDIPDGCVGLTVIYCVGPFSDYKKKCSCDIHWDANNKVRMPDYWEVTL
jgi:hypothetical protein